jgi:hypothetical protein
MPVVPTGATPLFWAAGNSTDVAPAVVVDAIAQVPGMIIRRANGTGAGQVIANDVIGNIGFRGWFTGGTPGYAAVGNARILVTALEAFTNVAQGTKLDIQTTAPGATASVVQATFDRGLTVGQPGVTPVQAVPAVGDLNCMRLLINGSAVAAGGVDTYSTVTAVATPGTPLTTQFVEVTGGTGGVALPTAGPGIRCKIRNSTGATISIYVFNGSGATINNGAANAPITLLVNSTAYLEASSALKWFTIP